EPAHAMTQRMGARQGERGDEKPSEKDVALEFPLSIEGEARQEEQADHQTPLQQYAGVALTEVPLHERGFVSGAEAAEKLAGDDEDEKRQRTKGGRWPFAVGDIAAEEGEHDDDGIELLQ